MPANKSKPARKQRWYKKRLFLVILVVLVLMSGSLLSWYKIRQHNIQEQKKERLANAGAVLDTIHQDYIASNGSDGIERLDYCYRAGVKYGQGWIICGRYLKVAGRANSESGVRNELSRLIESVNGSGYTNRLEDSSVIENRNGRWLGSTALYITDLGIGCSFSTYWPSGYGTENLKYYNYEFEIQCVEDHLDSFIYPEQNYKIPGSED